MIITLFIFWENDTTQCWNICNDTVPRVKSHYHNMPIFSQQWHHQKTTAELTSEKEPKISTTVSAQKSNFQNSKTNATSKLKSGGRKSKPNSTSTQKSSSNQNSKKGVERKHSPRQQPWQKQNVSKHRSSKLAITHPNSNLTRRWSSWITFVMEYWLPKL